MKKSLLNIITLVLVLMNTILTGIMVFVIVPAMQDSNRVVKKVAQAINLEIYDGKELDLSNVPFEDCETFDLGGAKLTILLKKGSDGKDHYAVFYPSLLLYKNADNYSKELETLTSNQELVKQHIQEVVGRYTVNELQSDADAVRDAALKELQEVFGKNVIVQVVFGPITLQ